MRLINRIDLFKQNFHFLINKKTSYHTFFGGICSFILIITLVILTYFIGKPLWYHKNPTVTTSTIQTDEQSKVNFSNADIFLLLQSLTHSEMTLSTIKIKYLLI